MTDAGAGRARARRALVTGAAGFVGANLVRRLLADGHEVVAAHSGGETWRLDAVRADVELVALDVRRADDVRAVVRRARPEWLFHLAAHGGHSWHDEARRIYETNVIGTSNVVAAAGADVEALVHAGSSSEYGFKDHPPSEAEVLEPNSDYAVAKAAATHIVATAARERGLPAATLRLYSAYGPFEHPDRLLPTLIVQGLRGRLPPLVDPETARDFVHVDDVCEAFVHVARRAAPGREGIYNVGSGEQTTLREIVALVRRVLQIEEEPAWGSMPARDWDTVTWVANVDRLKATGWRPRIDLEEGIRRTVEWFRGDPSLLAAYAPELRKDRSSRGGVHA